jgi:hypothetical protein
MPPSDLTSACGSLPRAIAAWELPQNDAIRRVPLSSRQRRYAVAAQGSVGSREAVNVGTSQPVLPAASQLVSASSQRVKVGEAGEGRSSWCAAIDPGESAKHRGGGTTRRRHRSRLRQVQPRAGIGPCVLGAGTKITPRSRVSLIDGIGGFVAGLAMGSVILWKNRRQWRNGQLIYS